MLRRLTIAMSVLTAVSVSSGFAQSTFSMELNGGAALPTQDLGTTKLAPGFGLGFTANVRVMPHLHLYAGWDYHRFVTDEPLVGSDYDLNDTGYAFGAKFQHPFADRLEGWVRAGGLFNHIELEDSEGEIVSDTGHELGWEAGAGLSVVVTPRLAIMPGTRFRTYASTLTVGQNNIDVDLSYITAELRFAFKFGGPPVSAMMR